MALIFTYLIIWKENKSCSTMSGFINQNMVLLPKHTQPCASKSEIWIPDNSINVTKILRIIILIKKNSIWIWLAKEKMIAYSLTIT